MSHYPRLANINKDNETLRKINRFGAFLENFAASTALNTRLADIIPEQALQDAATLESSGYIRARSWYVTGDFDKERSVISAVLAELVQSPTELETMFKLGAIVGPLTTDVQLRKEIESNDPVETRFIPGVSIYLPEDRLQQLTDK
jgi:hypothetical protein